MLHLCDGTKCSVDGRLGYSGAAGVEQCVAHCCDDVSNGRSHAAARGASRTTSPRDKLAESTIAIPSGPVSEGEAEKPRNQHRWKRSERRRKEQLLHAL